MKRGLLVFLVLLVACAKAPEQTLPVIPVFEIPPVETASPVPVVLPEILHGDVGEYLINKEIFPYSLVSTEIVDDNFAIIPVTRYDARYFADGITAQISVFRFSSRQELDVVLNSEFYDIINFGSISFRKQTVASFLSNEEHQVIIWPSDTVLVYLETFAPFSALEILEAYLQKYPSDLKTSRCIDSDGNDHFMKGTTTNVKMGSTVLEWTDVCLRDFFAYRNNQYTPTKKISEQDGLLEGRCESDPNLPGYIVEYVCPRGCLDGVCK